MRKTFLLYGLSLLIYSQAYTQSSLHDTSLEAKFQDALELFQKDQFSSSREAFDRLSLHPDVKTIVEKSPLLIIEHCPPCMVISLKELP